MTKVSKSTSGLVSKTKLNNFLDILVYLNKQIDMLRIKNKQKVENVSSFIFFHKYRKKHDLQECPVDNINICEIFEASHNSKYVPSFQGSKVAYWGENKTQEQSCHVTPR